MGLEKILGTSKASLILLHPTSLPDPDGKAYGIGELSCESFKLIDFLVEAGVTAWQTLPLGHTGYGNSPYQTYSRFAGSPYIISVEKLLERGDISQEQHDNYVKKVIAHNKSSCEADFGWLFENKIGKNTCSDAILRQAFKNFAQRKDSRQDEFKNFCNKEFSWLDDYSEFMALKELNNYKQWQEWENQFKDINIWRAKKLKNDTNDLIFFYKYLQFVFFEQWSDVKHYANEKGRKIVGDIPFYVGYDSADAWANRDIFELDAEGVPLYVAGVPPDYFSPTGQLWGNPVYDWKNPKTFEWWAYATEHILNMVDILRIDHFRAVDSFWKISYEVAVNEKTAVKGFWSKGPGKTLLKNIKERLVKKGKINDNQLPFIAEDLGFLDPLYATPEDYPTTIKPEQRFFLDETFKDMILSKSEDLGIALNHETREYSTRKGVDLLLEEFDLPFMLVLQFGIEGDKRSQPGYAPENCVYYTGTHDNDTAEGWSRTLNEESVSNLNEHLKISDIYSKLKKTSWGMIEIVESSKAVLASIPMQDLLGLGSEAKMNQPGNMRDGGWWTWRATKEQMECSDMSKLLKELNEKHHRFH